MGIRLYFWSPLFSQTKLITPLSDGIASISGFLLIEIFGNDSWKSGCSIPNSVGNLELKKTFLENSNMVQMLYKWARN